MATDIPPQIVIEHREVVDVRTLAIEQVARALCGADGKDPDADWRVNGSTMITVGDEHPENWRRYTAKAEEILKAAFSDRK